MGRTLEQIRGSRPQVDRARLEATTEADILRHAIEDGDAWDGASTGFVKRRPGQRGPGKRPIKAQVTLRVDPAALEAWRASGDGWMSRAADVLAREAPKAKRRG